MAPRDALEMLELALVDFDDTLVETAPAFQEAREALFRRMQEEGFSRKEAEEVHYREVEPELLAVFGMGPFRMEPSFRDTYLRLCARKGIPPQGEVADDCAALGREFLGHPRVMEGSLEALARLASRFPTVLYSQASQREYQLGRIRDAGVLDILPESRVRITPYKTLEAFQRVLGEFGVEDPAATVMIGNSVRSDINPALLAGAQAILVEPYDMWEYDRVPPVSPHFLRFPTFSAAVEHLLRDGAAGSA